VSVLPPVASRKALRVFARKNEAKNPLIGFGDPIFNAEEESRPGAQDRSLVATSSYTEFWQGQGADRTMLSRALQRLPGDGGGAKRRGEKSRCASKQHLSAPSDEITVKRAALSDYRVVYSRPTVSSPARSRDWRSRRSRLLCRSSRAM
jgi:hypothetical protein